MIRKAIVSLAGIGAVLAIMGCSSTPPQYQGASPSLRSVSGAPDTKNSYVGMNFKFVLDQPGAYHRPQLNEVATASAD